VPHTLQDIGSILTKVGPCSKEVPISHKHGRGREMAQEPTAT